MVSLLATASAVEMHQQALNGVLSRSCVFEIEWVDRFGQYLVSHMTKTIYSLHRLLAKSVLEYLMGRN
jgi:hypothetical protein